MAGHTRARATACAAGAKKAEKQLQTQNRKPIRDGKGKVIPASPTKTKKKLPWQLAVALFVLAGLCLVLCMIILNGVRNRPPFELPF